MGLLSKVKMLYRPKEKRGTADAPVILEALKENFDAMQEAIANLATNDLNEMEEYFNNITSEKELGTVLFNTENSYEDVLAKINELDDEAQ